MTCLGRLLGAALACTALIAATGAAADPDPGHGRVPLVLGGKGVKQGEFRSLVLVLYLIPRKEEAIFCTGTVVAPRVVLTAAHCVEPKGVSVEIENFRVAAGSVNWSESRDRLRKDVVNISTFEYTGRTFFGDVAVLELASPIEVPSMDVAGRRFWTGSTVAEMIGWGLTSPRQDGPTYLLHRAETIIRSPAQCRAEGAESKILCTSGSKQLRTSACYGDSGSPLLVRQPWNRRRVVVGVLSGGSACHREFGVNYYTPSNYFSDWLRKRIAEAERVG